MMHPKMTSMTTMHPMKKTPTNPKTTTKTTTKKKWPPRQSYVQSPKPRPRRSPPPKWPPPAAKKSTIALYSLDVHNAAIITYYNDEGIDYAEVKVYVNGVIPPGKSHFLLAEDRMSVSWQRAVDWRCFLKEHLCGVMCGKFSTSHSCVIAYCNVVQVMKRNKMIPDAGGLYWGTPQVIRLNQCCTGPPTKQSTPTPCSTRSRTATESSRGNTTPLRTAGCNWRSSATQTQV
jgi:hypothetical protein